MIFIIINRKESSMNTLLKITLVVVAAGILTSGCKKDQPPQPTANAAQTEQTTNAAQTEGNRNTAPDFTLTDQNGDTHTLGDYRGKIVVLEWINPDCPFVKRHYDKGTFIDMADEYAGDEVVWLAINSTHYFDTQKNLAFAQEKGVEYSILNDQSGKVGKLYSAKTTPEMVIIDKDGRIAYQGAIDNDPKGDKTEVINYARQALDQVLEGEKVTTPATTPYGCTVKYAE